MIKAIDPTKETRRQLVTWLKQFDTSHLVTITFAVEVTFKYASTIAAKMMRMVNRDLVGKNNCKRDPLKGFVISEYQHNGNPHFHLLINRHPRLESSKKDLKTILDKKAKAYKHLTQVNGKNRYVKLLNSRGIDVRDYYEGILEEYLVKDMKCDDSNCDFITTLSSDGFMSFPAL